MFGLCGSACESTEVGSATHTAAVMIANICSIFSRIRAAGLNLSINKFKFGKPQIVFLDDFTSSDAMTSNRFKVQNFLRDLKPPVNVKQFQRLNGFLMFSKEYIPDLARKLLPFYRLLRTDRVRINNGT